MGFRLVKTGRTYGEQWVGLQEAEAVGALEPSKLIISDELSKPVSFSSQVGDFIESTCQITSRRTSPTTGYVAGNTISKIISWAGDNPKRWKVLHNALLHIYYPVWERIDYRDILVAWAAAHLALTSAIQSLRKLNNLHHLTGRERDVKGARAADISFWGRLSANLDKDLPSALTHDVEATRVIVSILNDYHG